MADGTASRVSMTLDSTLDSVARVEAAALEYARNAGFDEDSASNLAMVAREAVVNAVIHGNRYDSTKHIIAAFEITEDALKISICDQGVGINVDELPNPLAPENLLRPSGRGIFLIRAFMDEVHFRKLAPGTEITLVKRRSARI